MNILFVGDVFGSAGRHIVREHLPHVLETNEVDLLVINGENAAGGFGITPPSQKSSSTSGPTSSPPATTSGTNARSSST
ncbi:YmdB family metallophosphoesterase [Tunturiibacter gelidiferens]